jgi:hypothetical protein
MRLLRHLAWRNPHLSRVLQATVEGKGHALQSQIRSYRAQRAVATGLAVHEVEHGLFQRLLALGYPLQRWFFTLLR